MLQVIAAVAGLLQLNIGFAIAAGQAPAYMYAVYDQAHEATEQQAAEAALRRSPPVRAPTITIIYHYA